VTSRRQRRFRTGLGLAALLIGSLAGVGAVSAAEVLPGAGTAHAIAPSHGSAHPAPPAPHNNACPGACYAQHNQCRIQSKGSPSCDAALTGCLRGCRH
jgi:hypothetical protein